MSVAALPSMTVSCQHRSNHDTTQRLAAFARLRHLKKRVLKINKLERGEAAIASAGKTDTVGEKTQCVTVSCHQDTIVSMKNMQLRLPVNSNELAEDDERDVSRAQT
ncbi:MAG: hypothetical protein C0620_08545 [Desulfuromonas sp.]|nr:MAG: hypothetical protein C0620_08545 [Desulfuromonas sp.]